MPGKPNSTTKVLSKPRPLAEQAEEIRRLFAEFKQSPALRRSMLQYEPEYCDADSPGLRGNAGPVRPTSTLTPEALRRRLNPARRISPRFLPGDAGLVESSNILPGERRNSIAR